MRALIVILSIISFGFPAHAQYYDDSLAVDQKLKPISQGEYMNAILLETSRKSHSSSDIFSDLGLTIDSECDEICETYLVDKRTRKKLLLPSSFDQGVMGLAPSPDHDRFVVYSSYDGPDYSSYYFYRAEIISYQLTEAKGLAAVHEQSSVHLYDWSIEDIVWVDDRTLVLKAYSGSKSSSGVNGGYSYFKLKL